MKYTKNIFITTIILISLSLTTCSKSTKPHIEPKHVCNDEYDISHESILVSFQRDLPYEAIEEFIIEYKQYGASITYDFAPDLNQYYIGFDHSKIHCVLFHLKILNDERVHSPLLFWYSSLTTWKPGYMVIVFHDHVNESNVQDFVKNSDIYEVKLYNVLAPLRKWYLFSYNYEKLLKLSDIFDEEIIYVMGIDKYYHTLIDSIKQ